MTDKEVIENEEVEILDEEIDLEVHVTAQPLGINMDGLVETPGLGFYLGDGVYI